MSTISNTSIHIMENCMVEAHASGGSLLLRIDGDTEVTLYGLAKGDLLKLSTVLGNLHRELEQDPKVIARITTTLGRE